MATDKKISEEIAGSPAVLTDNLEAQRGSGNVKLSVGDVRDFVSYQNSAMSAAVDVFVRRKSDGTIVEVYEPLRNNLIRFNSVTDKFRFDLSAWVNNTVVNCSFENISDDSIFANNTMFFVDIDGGNHSALTYSGNNHYGNNHQEITVSGDIVQITNNIIGKVEDAFSGYLHEIGANTTINGNTFYNQECDFHNSPAVNIVNNILNNSAGFEIFNHTQTNMQYSILDGGAYITFEDDTLGAGSTSFSGNHLRSGAYLDCYSYYITNCDFGNNSQCTFQNTGAQIDRCIIGPSSSIIFKDNHSNSEFINISDPGSGNYMPACDKSKFDNFTCADPWINQTFVQKSELVNVTIKNPGHGWRIEDSTMKNIVIDCKTDYSFAITGVNAGAKTFIISGKKATKFSAIALSNIFTVTGSTGNDGIYTVASASNVGNTTHIIVVESVPDGTIDGSISITKPPANLQYTFNDHVGHYGQTVDSTKAEIYLAGDDVIFTGNIIRSTYFKESQGDLGVYLKNIGDRFEFTGNNILADLYDFNVQDFVDCQFLKNSMTGGYSALRFTADGVIAEENVWLGTTGGADMGGYMGDNTFLVFSAGVTVVNDMIGNLVGPDIALDSSNGHIRNCSFLNRGYPGVPQTITPPNNIEHVTSCGLPDYSDNAAAIAGGLFINCLYQTSGAVKIVT